MSLENLDIRLAAKQASVFLYEVADALNISETSMTRLMRRPLSETKKTEIMNLIAQISAQKKFAERAVKTQ